MSDDPVDTCPECQSPVRRVIHPVGVVFKGSGWYITDSRSKNSAAAPADSNGDSKKSDEPKKSETAKSETAKTAAD
jgi:predicted nucleic acid-binding Zn ribbon protein